jgi:hypothetical protein
MRSFEDPRNARNHKMYIQALTRVGDPAVLALSWTSATFLQSILVQIATNEEFTESVRTFLIPVVHGCTLDTGVGNWYVRVGGLVGNVVQGYVEWTAGVYGPWPVVSPKPPVQAPGPKFKVIHTKTIPEGLRIHTDPLDRTLALWEVSEQTGFPASATKWYYGIGAGEFSIKSLVAEKRHRVRLHLLLVPVQMFEKPLNLVPTPLLGTEYKIHALCSGQTVSGIPLKSIRLTSSSDKTGSRADEAILHQATITPNMKFASHSDYLRYKAALERTK